MTILGWAQGETRRPLSPSAAFGVARDTWAMFDRLGLVPKHARWDQPAPAPTPQARTLARAALLGRAAAEPATARPASAERKSAPGRPEQTIQLRVRLRDVEPAIWRQLVVPASLTLRELHAAIQTAMGWQGYHLHLFEIDGVRYGDDVEDMDDPLDDEETFTVGQAAAAATGFSYDYDFGDGWTHDIQVEQVSAGTGPPHLVGGARMSTGGLRRTVGVPAPAPGAGRSSHEAHEQLLEWIGGTFDPEAFDLVETNAQLELFDRHTRRR